ncbi:MAG: zeta toxin family protein [Burkholderiales bacterium]|nr:zeta toxin family protein [Burkholderiales bacterium]
MHNQPQSTTEGPWNPGLQSQIPADLLPLATLYRPENVLTTLRQARELADLTGLAAEDLVVFRPERLVVHELLARVTADFSIDDGRKTEDLGINFRRITEIILTRHIAPHMAEIRDAHEALRTQLFNAVAEMLDYGLQEAAAAAPQARAGFWSRLFRNGTRAAPPVEEAEAGDLRAIRRWDAQAQSTSDPLQRAACMALARVASAMHARHGRIWGDRGLIAAVATDLAGNEYGSEQIGRLIEPYVRQAAQAEGFRLLPAQAQPVVMNTKGASAAGKSTLRPLQRALAARIGVSWDDFALISPDIFRKFLLDYATLGPAYKYAGALSGHELQIVDHKLDRTMARKAQRGAMSHLLIDRFRFDTFAPASDIAGSNLLTRFGNLVYLFFMITPPDATVERAWTRGLEVGRYKAIDDLLAHNIEAYTGMPEVFFTWALAGDKKVHYEFLDNSVALGERPRTVAFGWNGEMNVLDVKGLLDVDRYRRINVNARSAQEVHPGGGAMAPEHNTRFLAACVSRLPAVNFADRMSGRIYLRTEHGKMVWADPQILATALTDGETRAGIAAVAPQALQFSTAPATPRVLQDLIGQDRIHTLGQWGGNSVNI